MKTLAIIAVVLGLIYVAYAQTCDETIINECYTPYANCALNSNTTADACTCFGRYGNCLAGKNCFLGATRDAFLSQCSQAGCTTQQCNSAVASGINAALLLASLLFALYH
eukprot:TRINITY_DN7890_c0_g1_i1.p2 TRINITY_DN7890_c0_g1~~TRINITY_DN7890_c0_g1_i1.p2  ORF type:complete len:110 (+),score=19.93 TRINITY_DN7890_c0_g1_i1:332-661(+)